MDNTTEPNLAGPVATPVAPPEVAADAPAMPPLAPLAPLAPRDHTPPDGGAAADSEHGGVVIGAAQLRAVRDLYEQGQLLRAHELAASFAPLRRWRGPGSRVLAG